MKKISLIALAVLAFTAVIVAESRYVIKSTHVGNAAVAITCTNGGDPTGKMLDGNVLLISCGTTGTTTARK
jgi:hypothetical protein